MSDNKNIGIPPERNQLEIGDTKLQTSDASSIAGTVSTKRISSSSERLIKFERAQKCLENAALVSKRIKEHRKATAELLGRPFEEDEGDNISEMASTMSERTGYSAATDVSTTLSVQEALNIPGISESLANTLKQKELLMERIKQYKEISKKPTKSSTLRKEIKVEPKEDKRNLDKTEILQLTNTIKDKENTLSVLQDKIKGMETTILDLQEKIYEKDQIIEAKNMATTLMSDTLSKKEKDSLALLEDTKQQMVKMQENFVNMEAEWREEKMKLLEEIELKDEKISSLEEANVILEKDRFEISVTHSELMEQFNLKNKEIQELQEKIQELTEINIEDQSSKEKEYVEEEKGSLEIAAMIELTKKVELLEQLNCQIRQTNKELENKLSNMSTDQKSIVGSPSKKGSPLPTRKGARGTASKMKSPWTQLSSESLPQETDKKQMKNEISRLEMLVQSLNKDLLDKEYIISQKDDLISQLQNVNIEKNVISIDTKDIGICTDVIVEPKVMIESEKDIDDSEIEASNDIKPEDLAVLKEKLKTAEEQITLLNEDIDSANKNMIKVKSDNKIKLKKLQKTIDSFSKVSDANAEIIRLNDELHQLSQKVAELEEEKGNLQLHLVDYDSGRLTDSDIYKKLVEMENLAESRLHSISILEAQKFDLVQDLHTLQQKYTEIEDKLADISQLQNDQVCSEMKSVQLEEQIDELIASRKELELVIENLKLDKEQLNSNITLLKQEKEELVYKMENYIQENIELTDKLEKLSAEKVSSAESIEIVESLTTQEKLELEEYNNRISDDKIEDGHIDTSSPASDKCLDSLLEQTSELNKKIELFEEERQEVMGKMSKLSAENIALHHQIDELTKECGTLQNSIELFNYEKIELLKMNQEMDHQIEELKRERIEIMKESVESTKPTEDLVESVVLDSQNDEKISSEKGSNRTKSVKQLTKEILKLKNTIKDREAEIADCQMKILSLEEQEQKKNNLLQNIASFETKIKSLMDENVYLKEELDAVKLNKESEQQLLNYKATHDMLQQEIQNIRQEYSATINVRDMRITELEKLLLDYEDQIFNYRNTLQQKDKDITEYINQITKLNDVSQKLKSTIELLEEEKSKDQNADLVKSLNKQIAVYQKKLHDSEEKIIILENEKSHLITMKATLENEYTSLDIELKKLQAAFNDKQDHIKDLQSEKQKYSEELSNILLQTKERDEEIHEIKLQLRKESIENEKLRDSLSEKEKNLQDITHYVDEIKTTLDKLDTEKQEAIEKNNRISSEKDTLEEQFAALENKNKELLEKFKKIAINFKKKSAMYVDLETTLIETQKQLESKNLQVEQLLIQVETLPSLHEKLKHAEEEINRLQSYKSAINQKTSQDIIQLETETEDLRIRLENSIQQVSILSNTVNTLENKLHFAYEENTSLKTQIELLHKKLAEQEIEQKNNMNLITKVSGMEVEINHKQNELEDLRNKFENLEQLRVQTQFGYEAKLQERDLYLENLESDMSKYKNRICRLEESISAMENQRYSLERKADQLGNQLQEKQKAYSEYTSQEDELVSRLAVLMDHDRVVEKQLYEIESENKELQNKVVNLSEENQRLKKTLNDMQDYCNLLVNKAERVDAADIEISKYLSQVHELDVQLKRVTHDHQVLLAQKRQEIEDLEFEFNTQIENSIKEKKALMEKSEKYMEHINQLEQKLHDYKNNIDHLNINIEELNKINYELNIKAPSTKNVTPDYTEQYISEINHLTSILNGKNEEISLLHNQIQSQKNNSVALMSDFENKISDLKLKLNQSSIEMEKLVNETENLKQNNYELQQMLKQKEDQLKELIEKKKLTFEMSIPKTEGMIISSTIEEVKEDPQPFDLALLESQIVSNIDMVQENIKLTKVSENLQKQSKEQSGSNVEGAIVPKKTYLCYTENKNVSESDPFNSDEGWGLGESEDNVEAPDYSYLHDQIHKLKRDNEELTVELDLNKSKLVKALKKLKELKSSNDMLLHELKTERQLFKSDFADKAMEEELKIKVEDLEKRISDLTSDYNKEVREKESLRQQNKELNSANDRFTELKKKFEGEIELWKFKFKEANDTVSALQWEGDSQNSSQHPLKDVYPNTGEQYKEEIMKIEKENDELQLMIDQLTAQNKELLDQQGQFKQEIHNLNSQLLQIQSHPSLERMNDELLQTNEELSKNLASVEIRLNELTQEYNSLKIETENSLSKIEMDKKMLETKFSTLEHETSNLQLLNMESKDTISTLMSELDTAKENIILHENKQKTSVEQEFNIEQLNILEDNCAKLKQDLENANKKIKQLEKNNEQILLKSSNYEDQISELNTKIQNLNTENDHLLSSVAELRSTLSTAVDQRGLEIAELWKQHLAQRELDFQKVEHELRQQINAADAKYEQLLDNVQKSSQEETDKIIMTEQVSSLQNKLQDKEEHVKILQNKYGELVQQLDMLRSEMEDEKVAHDHKLLEQQEDYEKVIQELTSKNQSVVETYKQSLKNIQNELAGSETVNDELNQQILLLKNKIGEMESTITELTNQLRIKESEIYQKTHEYTIALTQRNDEFEIIRKQLIEYEKKIEDITFEKESELAILRLKIHDIENHNQKIHQEFNTEKSKLIEALNEKITECTNLNRQIVELNQALDDHSKKSAEMQTALENQEIEIVSLNDEIMNLQNMLRSANSKIQKHVSFASDTKPGDSEVDESAITLNKELLDAVPRAELDLALYMLHQRDVRCEELTMELTQLLEERDTLQLRLSDSLRLNEDLKLRVKSSGLDVLVDSTSEINSELSSLNLEREHFVDTHRGLSFSGNSSMNDPDGDKPKLQAKLSELRGVRHSRDVRLRQESEQRQMDLRLLQRDVANLPTEAVEQLAQAHHTLSRDSQSTSTVLLNWLRGKSTPKVVHM